MPDTPMTQDDHDRAALNAILDRDFPPHLRKPTEAEHQAKIRAHPDYGKYPDYMIEADLESQARTTRSLPDTKDVISSSLATPAPQADNTLLAALADDQSPEQAKPARFDRAVSNAHRVEKLMAGRFPYSPIVHLPGALPSGDEVRAYFDWTDLLFRTNGCRGLRSYKHLPFVTMASRGCFLARPSYLEWNMGQVTPIRAEYLGGFRTRAEAYWTARYRVEAAMNHFTAYKKLAESKGYNMITSNDSTGRLYKGITQDEARPITKVEWLDLDHEYLRMVKPGSDEEEEAMLAHLEAMVDPKSR